MSSLASSAVTRSRYECEGRLICQMRGASDRSCSAVIWTRSFPEGAGPLYATRTYDIACVRSAAPRPRWTIVMGRPGDSPMIERKAEPLTASCMLSAVWSLINPILPGSVGSRGSSSPSIILNRWVLHLLYRRGSQTEARLGILIVRAGRLWSIFLARCRHRGRLLADRLERSPLSPGVRAGVEGGRVPTVHGRGLVQH